MTHSAIQQWLRKESFEPFSVLLSNGERCEVRHPENAALLQTSLIVTQPGSDQYAELTLLHVGGVERLTAPQPAAE